MTPEIAEAIESARTVATGPSSLSNPVPRRSTAMVKAILLSVARDLPQEMTMADLAEELEG